MSEAPPREGARPRWLEGAAGWLLFLLAAALRLPALGLRPLHHDEGSNVIFILRLVREGVFEYDPTNYHGPLPFYAEAASFLLFGVGTWALRIVPALLGSALSPLAWSLRRFAGRTAAGAAAALLAVSPALVYYARDAIHETYLVFLTLGLVAAGGRALETSGVVPALLAGLAAGGVIATKETAVIVFAALAAGAAAAWPVRPAGGVFASRRRLMRLLLVAAAVGATLGLASYTHGFRDPAGLAAPLASVRSWGRRAIAGDGHEKPWWYFLALLAREEWAIVLPALLGVTSALRRRSAGDRFLLGWGGATLVAYSLIPYKTPWLVLNLLIPLALLAGTGVAALAGGGALPAVESRPGGAAWRRRAALAMMVFLVPVSGGRALRLSFVRYDSDREPLVYVQTRRQVLDLVRRLEDAARGDPEGRGLRVDIVSPDYLPLNWYLRDFTNVAYHGHLVEPLAGAAVIARRDQAEEVRALLGPGHSEEEFDLRPGVRLVLFLRTGAGRGAAGLEAGPGGG